jgi:hypothetical protein
MVVSVVADSNLWCRASMRLGFSDFLHIIKTTTACETFHAGFPSSFSLVQVPKFHANLPREPFFLSSQCKLNMFTCPSRSHTSLNIFSHLSTNQPTSFWRLRHRCSWLPSMAKKKKKSTLPTPHPIELDLTFDPTCAHASVSRISSTSRGFRVQPRTN